MRIFYFGSVCSNEKFNETVAESKIKPSASAQNFEYALMKGFSECQDADITIASAESIAAFPNGNRLFLKKRCDVLTEKLNAQIIPAINWYGIKQSNHADGAARLLKKWLKKNKLYEEKCVLVYGIYPNVIEKLQKICKKHGCKIYVIITDIPFTMFTYTKTQNLLKRLFAGTYRKKAINLQNRFDGYIYLTEDMKNEVAPEKPYFVMETIADPTIFDNVGSRKKSNPPALMYAGALNKKYGIDLIIESFEKIKTDSELWLFGSGDYEAEIIKQSELNPKIKYFGRVSREEVLKKEVEATLLLNIRDAEDIYTKYSFPSKMIEYMLSGTPVFTTKLSGIPKEYDPYYFTAIKREAQSIANQIDAVLKSDDLENIGKAARKFVKEEKNCKVQAGKVVTFLKQQIKEG